MKCISTAALDRMFRRGDASEGLTLLEVVLTLSLAVVISGLIGGAVRIYGIEMNVRDLEMRQTELAAKLLGMIERDLSAAIRITPIETEPLQNLLLASVAAESTPSTDEDLSAAGVPSDDAAAETDAALLLTGTMVLQSPGLIGTADQLQVDVSQLPRSDQYMTDPGDPAELSDVPSDLKTVAYLVQSPGFVGGARDAVAEISVDGDAAGSSGGLVRRSIDRGIGNESTLVGGVSRLNRSGRIIAPEVRQIQFSYFDGVTWLPTWNSDETGVLPMAVEVVVTLGPQDESANNPATSTSGETPWTNYRHVVRVPMGRPAEAETTQEPIAEPTDAAL